jgi:hypothetical protein
MSRGPRGIQTSYDAPPSLTIRNRVAPFHFLSDTAVTSENDAACLERLGDRLEAGHLRIMPGLKRGQRATAKPAPLGRSGLTDAKKASGCTDLTAPDQKHAQIVHRIERG